MFEVALQFLSQLIDLIPLIIALWLLFDLIGALLFGTK